MGRHLLNVAVFISAITAIYSQHVGHDNIYVVCKPLTTVLILLIPILFGDRSSKRYLYSIILALVFCLAGDTFLLRADFFLYGLGSFFIAHLLFAQGFLTFGGFKRYMLPLFILGLIGGTFFVYLSNSLGALSIPVAVYMLVIVFMCWQGVSLYLYQKNFVFRLIGIAVMLFLVSDAILAVNKFKHPFPTAGVFILTTYWLSITLLANSSVYSPDKPA